MSLVEKLFGSFSDRELKKINPIANQGHRSEWKRQNSHYHAGTLIANGRMAKSKWRSNL